MRWRIAAVICGLAFAGQPSCLSRAPILAALPPPDSALLKRKATVRFLRAKKRALEQKPNVDPKTWSYENEASALPAHEWCLADPIDLSKKDIGISSVFRDPNHAYELFKGYHTGIDIPAPVGTPVLAPVGGTVRKAYDERVEEAWYVIVDVGEGWRFRVLHLSHVSVAEGDAVRAGQVLGLSGAEPDDYGSGPYTTGPHLHFDLVQDGAFVDPRPHFCGAPLKSDP